MASAMQLRRWAPFIVAAIAMVGLMLSASGAAHAAAKPEWVKVSQAQAKRMATQTGFAIGKDGAKKSTPKKCWRATVLSTDPNVGIVYKTKWGKDHSYDAGNTCGVMESYLAPVAVFTDGQWVKVADQYFPDCTKVKKDLMAYGVSRANAKFVISTLTCQ